MQTDPQAPLLSSSSPLPTVVIVGRANVGKSTLFNKLAGIRRSMISPLPGTTRDVHESTVAWRDRRFTLKDTGGLDISKDNTTIPASVIKMATRAIASADCIVLMTDAREGILPSDKKIVRDLRKYKKPILFAVNKADSPKYRTAEQELWSMGLGEPLFLSAINGSGIGDLLDAILKALPRHSSDTHDEPAVPSRIKIGIFGKPNVGKSTLLNGIVGTERVVVSPTAHTTREPVDTDITWQGAPCTIIDTAGIRRKVRVTRGIEGQGVRRSIETLDRTDVVFLVFDLSEGINDQDKALAGLIAEHGIGMVLVGNKWDLIPHDHVSSELPLLPRDSKTGTHDEGGRYLKYIRASVPFATWAPVVFMSAAHHSNIDRAMTLAINTAKARTQYLSDDECDVTARRALTRQPMSRLGPKHLRPNYISFVQTRSQPPSFVLTVQTKEKFPSTYLRYLENELRRTYDFTGTPVQVLVNTIR